MLNALFDAGLTLPPIFAAVEATFYLNHLIYIGIFVVLALSLNLINGYSGMFSLGHHGFWAVGTMCAFWFLSMFYPSSDPANFRPLPIADVELTTRLLLFGGAILFSTLMAMICGLIIGVPCLRLRGDYLAIATLGFGEIIFLVSKYFMNVKLNRSAGDLPELLVQYTAETKTDFFTFFFVAVWLTVIVVAVAIHFLIKSSHGRAILAIREDEIPAELVGVNVTGYKILVFVLGAGMAGFIGALGALFWRAANPDEFKFMAGVIILMMIVLGGQGSITGAIVGAIMLYILREILKQDLSFPDLGINLSNLTQWDYTIFAVMLVLLMLNKPEGLMGRRELADVWPFRLLFRKKSSPELALASADTTSTPTPSRTLGAAKPSQEAAETQVGVKELGAATGDSDGETPSDSGPAPVSFQPTEVPGTRGGESRAGIPVWASIMAVLTLITGIFGLFLGLTLLLGPAPNGWSTAIVQILGIALTVQGAISLLAGAGLFRQKHWAKVIALFVFVVVGFGHLLALLMGYPQGIAGLIYHAIGFILGVRHSFPAVTPAPTSTPAPPATATASESGETPATPAVAPPPQPLLKITGVTKYFGGLKAVSDFNLELYPGELVGLIGPNGAGKTTCFNLITGVYVPSEGEINFRTTAIHGRKPYEIVVRGVARTFQNIRLFKDLTALENVRVAFNALTAPRYWHELSFAARSLPKWLYAPHRRAAELDADVAELDRRYREILAAPGMADIRYGLPQALFRTPKFAAAERLITQRSRELLDIFNLRHRENSPAGSLPYGEQRRLEIARALATRPKLLILDEPAAGMNPQETDDLMHLIEWVRKEFDLTVLLIEHDMKLVMGICERLVVLDHGETIARGKPAEIQANPEVIKAYLGEEAVTG